MQTLQASHVSIGGATRTTSSSSLPAARAYLSKRTATAPKLTTWRHKRWRQARASGTPNAQLSVAENLACGAIGRTAQISSTFPIDTIKIRVQVSGLSASAGSSSSPAPTTAISRLVSAVKRGNLYGGVSVSLMGQVPYGMLTFGIYETIKGIFANSQVQTLPQWAQTALAASIGDAVGSLWLTPSEVVKSKTQAGMYNNASSTIRALSKQGIGAFYQGYSAALARDIPFRVIQLSIYEGARSWYMKRSDKGIDEISAIENLIMGAAAGSITAAVTCPLDVVRSRMMSQPKGTYKNAIDRV
ncbi:putative S-adenosylmethionine carrier 2, chloroplastic [Gracilariopsis chorda]|uniref:Putative S-adenosylmethionine carrier 2, chloroplastic n=1 Tax=Gracilariopsis chorda TaxID=448386 RepID=A0A2V3IM27_9FLOR|nr:putative S-adenosylmethionine carrier 2, chloroplastic [Gracilariopsis chorda]|eukprot:PXF43142.1 putative S-adenosylmethionine carrier 2, chloroplastic [Gracilariopsis chorda]